MTDSTTTTSSMDTSTASVSTPEPASTPSSSPETSAPASSWDEAFARAEAAGTSATADTDQTATTAPAPATSEPTAEAQAAETENATPSQNGPIPFERHKAILDNVRQKTAQELVAKVEQQYGPAIQLQNMLRENTLGTLQQLMDEALTDPTIGPQMLSHVARTLASKRGQAKVHEEPQPDLQTADGTLVYSAEQLAKREQWVRDQLLQEVEARTAPLKQDLQARNAERALEQQRAQTRTQVTDRLGQWRGKPGFTEHEADIAERQKGYVSQGHDPWTSLAFAYTDVYHEKVVPTLRAQDNQKLVAGAVAKARASTSNPATVTPTPPQGMAKSWDEAFDRAGLKS